jgi:acetyltransferase-like isoleucine patch superfamily enzyme
MGEGVRIDTGVSFVNPEWVSLGDRTYVDKNVLISAGPPHVGLRKVARRPTSGFSHREGEVVVGSCCHLSSQAVILGHGGVSIGDYVTVSTGARVVSLSHHHRNLDDPADTFRYRFGSMAPEPEQALISAPVVIERNGAVGANAVVLPGSVIAADGWLGAGSVLSGSVAAAHIAAGAPARTLSVRA